MANLTGVFRNACPCEIACQPHVELHDEQVKLAHGSSGQHLHDMQSMLVVGSWVAYDHMVARSQPAACGHTSDLEQTEADSTALTNGPMVEETGWKPVYKEESHTYH